MATDRSDRRPEQDSTNHEKERVTTPAAQGVAEGPASAAQLAAERERLMEELREVNQRLVIANVRAQEQAEQLAEMDRRKDQFLAMLAHELRNPLAPIRNAVDVLKIQPGSSGSDLQWAIEVIDHQLEHLTHLVDDLLDIARITRGQIQLQKQAVDLADIVARAVETVQPLMEARRHELQVSLPVKPVWVEADPIRLTQVVANLLNNAAKYTEEGGHIWLTVQREGSEAIVKVRDTGMGIPAESLPHVFDLFSQLNHSPAHSSGGLGLGLTLVRHLVQMHGGRIQAHSAGPGQGSEFVVYLPRLTEVQRPAQRRDGGGKAESPSRRILVVDDNEQVADALTMLLSTVGHEVHTEHTGQAALRAIQTFQPEVVLLDIGLPDMDGYEVARCLREQGLPGEVRLIALSGYGQEQGVRDREKTPFDHYLLKPVSLDDLQALLSASS